MISTEWDQTGVLVHANVDYNIELPMVSIHGLKHFRLSHPIIVLRGAGCRDQGGFNDRALLYGHIIDLEIGFQRQKDPLAQVLLLH